MRAVVTGAGGLIGRALSERLRADGAEVVGVDLNADPGRGIVAGDITDRDGAWREALRDADLVVHTAARVSNVGPAAAFWELNVLGTRRVVEAAAEGGVRRLLHVSSVRAFSDVDFPDGVDETWPVRTDGHHYVDTKVASEQVVLQAHAAGEIEATIVRPGDVYGPGSRPWTILPVKELKARRFMLPAMGRSVFSPVYVDNLVDGMIAAARAPEGAGQVFTLSDGLGVPTREFFGHYARMLGRRGVPVAPTRVVQGLAAVATLQPGESEVTPQVVAYLTRRGTYSIAKARRVLGYEPRVDLAEGMSRTEDWLREQDLL